MEIKETNTIYGGELKPAIVTADARDRYFLQLDTEYPLNSSTPIGHSSLRIINPVQKKVKMNISFGPGNRGYNVFAYNCSNATADALEFFTGRPVVAKFFTTPGDVRDYFTKNLGVSPSPVRRNGVYLDRQEIPLNHEQVEALYKYMRAFGKKTSGFKGNSMFQTPLPKLKIK